ncbi:MAG: tetratricopeptide repeat protein [Gammaproteobacteria bacterium]|nr:tetratricopeptide repeat protein [Gammaproteobacteria bacterium]
MSAAAWVMIAGLSLWPFGDKSDDADVATIDSLDRQTPVLVEKDDPGTSGQNAIQSYREFLRLYPDNPKLRAEAMRRLADLQLEAGEEKMIEGDLAMLQGSEYRDAVHLYESLLQQNPANPDNDRILYQLARAYENTNQTEKALKTLDQLVSRYADSPRAIEAQFRRGEILFVAKQYYPAQQAYSGVVAGGDESRYYEQSLYKLGWSMFKQGEYESGLDSFFQLLDRRLVDQQGELVSTEFMTRPERELIDDTFRVSSVSISYLEGPATLDRRMAGDTPPVYAYLLYEGLGNLYLDKERYQDAAESYRSFAVTRPMHELAPLMRTRVVDTYEEGDFPSLVLLAKQEFVDEYDVDSAYWTRHEWQSRIEVTVLLQEHLDDLATHYHAVSQQSEEPESYDLAADYYRRLIRAFPEDPATAEANFLLAEILFESGYYAESAVEYERAAYFYPLSPHAAEAAYAAVLAYQAHEPSLQGEARADWHLQGIDSALRFAGRFPEHPESLPVQTQAAEALYELGELQGALAAAQPVLGNPNAPDELLRVAWTVDGHSNFDLDNYPASEVSYLNVRDLTAANHPGLPDLDERIASSIYKQGEIARDSGDLEIAVMHFARVGEMAPGSKIVMTADYDAAAVLLAMEDWHRAAPALEEFRQKYPDHDSVTDIGRSLAQTYEKSGRALAAATEYRRIADDKSEPADIRREALWHTAELLENEAVADDAAEVWRLYIKRYPLPIDDSMQLREKLVAYYAEWDDEKARVSWLRAIVSADATAGESRSDYSRTVAAKASLDLARPKLASFNAIKLKVPLKDSLAMKTKSMGQALDAYAAAADYGIAEVTTEATFHIAEIYHQLSRDLMGSERPNELSAEELDQYEILLEEQAYPFEEQAIEIHQANTARAAEGLYNEWVQASFVELAILMPARYAKVEISEDYVNTM